MTDLENILPLWNELEVSGADYVLATVVAVEGSSYRRPGARMLLAEEGRRAGTVSGGCLEAEVARRAWWLTANGPVVERYSTLEDDGDLPYGSGCGGVVYILLERRQTASRLLHALKAAFDARRPLAIATILEGSFLGARAFAGLPFGSEIPAPAHDLDAGATLLLETLAQNALTHRTSLDNKVLVRGAQVRAWADYRAPRPGLWIFGAGDDARPLLRLARELGWFVAVLDGRSHLVTESRFPSADLVRTLQIGELPTAAAQQLPLLHTDAAVLMTHSFEQDTHILASLLDERQSFPFAYVGVLGPQRRSYEALVEAARLRGYSPDSKSIERWMRQLHAPTGMDLGAETPATIALSILAEIQQALSAATALPLRQVRAAKMVVASSS